MGIMALPTPPTFEPTQIRAGDSARWSRSLADYPADTWTLSYTLNGSETITITASADGADHLVAVLPAVTGDWSSGDYVWTARVTDGTDTFTVDGGAIEILANPASVVTVDARSHVHTVLDAIEAVLEGRASHDVASYTIGGRQLNRMSIEDLLMWRTKYRGELSNERERARRTRGLPSRRQIGVQF